MSVIPDRHLRVLEKANIECCDTKALMGDLVDNDILPSLKARIESHLECCEQCQKFRIEYLATIELARSLKPKTMPLEAQNRLRAALNKRLGLSLQMVS
ncbi:MAG: hypothetical protein J5J00_03225 [Deltaproteobacteria bacterium]|nr:hypothetical protein [Deltaproteobacteria bacterium]